MASNIVFSGIASLLVVYLVAHGFVKSGAPGLLFLACGVLAWAGTSALSVFFGNDDANLTVTIHNLGAALAGALHLTGALLLGRRTWVIRSAGLVLPFALAGTTCAMILIVLVSRAQILPVFFVPNLGGTWSRQAVLGAAVAMFALAAAVLATRPTLRERIFEGWYGVALGLVAMGLFGVMMVHNLADTVSWLGRAAQSLSGVYMLVAAVAGLREANLVAISLQASLHESEQRFRALVLASSDIVYRVSPDWGEMRHLIRHDFFSDKELPSRDWLHKYIHPDDQPAVLEAIKQAIASKSNFEFEHRVPRPAGEAVWSHSRAIPIKNANGEIVEWFGMASDITERKVAEAERERLLRELRNTQEQLYAELDAMTRLQRLGTLLPREIGLNVILDQIVGAAVAIADADFGTIQLFDPQRDELKIVAFRGFEKSWLESWERVGRGEGACGRALERGERVVVEDVETNPIFVGRPSLELLRRVGVRACQSTPLISRTGRTLGIFSTHYRNPGVPEDRTLRLLDLLARQASDMVEGVQADEALRAANAQLVESDRRKNEFLASLSHELRNPLAPISNGLVILDLAPAGSEQAERAKRIIARQVGQLSALVNDLLDITRITRNKIHLNKQRLDLNEAVRLALEDSRSCFEQARVQVELVPSTVPVPILADPTRIAQIVGNLLSNSAKFTREGGNTRVSVTCEGQHAVLRVADDGIGMDAKTLERLFEPFMQAAQSLDRSQGGLGMGLAMVKGLVELHGGSVSARSGGPGRGAELTARFPLDGAVVVQAALPEARLSQARRRVLVIEDNIDAANSLREVLEFSNHQVEVAHTGPEGIAKAESYRPEVILCDIGLPQMDGYQVARALRANREFDEVFLVALSGYALPEDRANAFAAGFDRHLSKPPSMEALEQILLAEAPSKENTVELRV
jgi:signal transduction histidine kinase/PAS domain-containing protein/ActR/RegA family two-component response regulator